MLYGLQASEETCDFTAGFNGWRHLHLLPYCTPPGSLGGTHCTQPVQWPSSCLIFVNTKEDILISVWRTPFSCWFLNPNLDGWGCTCSEQILRKLPWSKNIFNAHLFLTECIRNIYHVNEFYQRNVVLGGFSIKEKEHPPVCGGVLVCSRRLGCLYDSQSNNWGVCQGGGRRRVLTESSSCFLLVAWKSYMTPSSTITHGFHGHLHQG